MGEILYQIKANSLEVLVSLIKDHNEAYRKGEPVVSDAYYDCEIQMLRKMDPENEWLKHIEPAPVADSRKRKLPIAMKSLNKAKDTYELKRWAESLGLMSNTKLVIMPKFDGASILYNESTGSAYSRGGVENEGQDCTSHLLMCLGESLPGQSLYTYGELVFSTSSWKQNFADKTSPYTGLPYKSPRNTAAGLINRDIASEELQFVEFYRYGMDDATAANYSTFSDLLDDISKQYNQIKLYKTLELKDVFDDKKLIALFQLWRKQYYIDGLVVYIDLIDMWKQIGRHSSTSNPLYAIAYKHPDFTESFETHVKKINWKISKSGALKPVVNIDMVDTGDCNMENPTGYNAGWLADRDIAVGATLLVTRGGGVIPKILDVLAPATQEAIESQWDELSECPVCGSHTGWNASNIELCCSNPLCPGVQLAKIIFFFNTCGVEEMGEETFNKLFAAGFTTIYKLLNITYDNIVRIDSFGYVTAENILKNMESIKQGRDLPTLMHASDCFAGVGSAKAKKLIETMPELDRQLLYSLQYAPTPTNERISTTTYAFHKGLQPFYELIKETAIPILPWGVKQKTTGDQCDGLSVCFSGVRDKKLEEMVELSGGKVVSGVTSTTTHLLVKDPNATSSKIVKAKSIGARILTIEEFNSLYF